MVQDKHRNSLQTEPDRLFSWLVRESDRKLASVGIVRGRSRSEAYLLMIKKIRTKAYDSFRSICSSDCCDVDFSSVKELKIPANSSSLNPLDLDHLIAEQGWFDPLPTTQGDLPPLSLNEVGFPDLVLDIGGTPQFQAHGPSSGHPKRKTPEKVTKKQKTVSVGQPRDGNSVIVRYPCSLAAKSIDKEETVIPNYEPQHSPVCSSFKPDKRKRVLDEDSDLRPRKDSGIDDCF